MGITNPANEQSIRNVHNLYMSGDILVTNTGNANKSGIFNNTFTLDYQTANAMLANYYDPIYVLGANIIGETLEPLKGYCIYGHPNKFYYDYLQEINNCGVVSSLNILAMAGVKNISQLTYADMVHNAKVNAEIQKAQENGEFYTGPGHISKANTEMAFTLWAIQNSKNDLEYYYNYHNFIKQTNPDGSQSTSLGYYDSKEIDNIDESFCLHDYDYTYYKNTGNIDLADGGTYIWHQENILDYHKVASKIDSIKIEIVAENEPEQKTLELPPARSEGDDLIKISKSQNEEFLFVGGTPGEDLLGNSVDPPTHYYIEIDMTKEQILNQHYCWIKDGDDAIIQFDDNTSLTLQGYYSATNEYSYSISFIKEGSTSNEKEPAVSLQYFEFECTNKNKFVFKDSNRYKYEYVYELEHYFYEGKGIIMGGDAGFLKGNSPAGGHAISVVGIVLEDGEVLNWYKDNGEKLELTNSYTINDVSGFMVVDSGGWIGSDYEAFINESAQFISTETFYNFITGSYYTENTKGLYETYDFISTEDEIRSWADHLNLIGNNRKNILIGNDGNNIIKGKGGADHIEAMLGNDIIYGDAGNDVIYGNSGNDTMYGGSGDDKFIFRAVDALDKNDNLVASHDVIDVGTGRDELEFNDESLTYNTETSSIVKNFKFDKNSFQYFNKDGDLLITYDITVETKTNDLSANRTDTTFDIVKDNSILILGYFSKKKFHVLKSIKFGTAFEITENLDFIKEILSKGKIIYTPDMNRPNDMLGTMYGDNITGGNYNDTIKANEDSDTLDGGCGNDIIYAGSGNDTIYGSHGNDTIYTDSGKTAIVYEIGKYSGSDYIIPGKGIDYIILKDDGTLGISENDMIYSKNKNDLVITYDENTGGSITIKNYFSKKGKTSIKSIEIPSTGETIELVSKYNEILAAANELDKTGRKGNNTITGTAAGERLDGELGFDTIKAGAGNDTLVGGLNNDALYGQAGENTYEFNAHASGNDTIYTTSKSQTILDFSNTDITFDKKGLTTEHKLSDFAFTKNKNDLILNYATTVEENGNSQITISNFFKSKDEFSIIDGNNDTINLQEATIYFDVEAEKSNKLTTSNINDYIICSDKNDTIKALSGNDTIISGKGSDNITAGIGNNVINYNIGDGLDTITLTKNENLTINVNNAISTNNISFRVEKNDLIISYTNEYNLTEDILNIKNFGKKDTTTENGSVVLNINQDYEIDLRNDIFLPTYEDFTIAKNKYNGNWLSEKIDASILNKQLISINKGANIKGNNGNDSIIGSEYSDTINGGNGDDIIITNQTQNTGKNTIDGANGSDVYKLFYDRTHQIDNHGQNIQTTYEITNIKDTGKNVSDIDRVYLNLNKSELIIEDGNSIAESGSFWFNIDQKGKFTNTIYLETFDGKNIATLTNIEEIYTKDNYTYNMNAVIDDIVDVLKEKGIKDIATLMKSNDYPATQAAILKIFAKGWEEVSGKVFNGTDEAETIKNDGITGLDTINALAGDDKISAGDRILIVNAGDGNDTIYGKSTETIQELYGEAGNDKISSGEVGATLYGGEGNDTLIGNKSEDTIIGGTGDDLIYGSGKDSIIISNGDGNDTYLYGVGKDTIHLKDIEFMNLSMKKEGNDLIMTSNSDSLRIAYAYSNEAICENLIFIDKTETQYSFKELLNNSQITYETNDSDETIVAPSFGNYEINTKGGNDKITSKQGADTITAGLGNDTINGSGNDLILFNSGDGNDEYHFGEAQTSDTIKFNDISFTDMTFSKKDTDLIITNGEDAVIISNLYSGNSVKENLHLEDNSHTQKGIIEVLNTEQINVYGNDSTNDRINLNYAAGNYNIYTGDGNDEIQGGKGNNTIFAGTGNDKIIGTGKDVIIFNTGDDKDTYIRKELENITDTTEIEITGRDTISFTDTNFADLSLAKENDDLIIFLNDTDNIRISNVFNAETNELIYDLGLKDATNTEKTLSSYLETATLTLNGTNGNDTLTGLEDSNNKILAGAGNDKITSLGGADVIYGGAGNDTITGTGNDTLVFETNHGQDRYIFSANKDTLSFADITFNDMTLSKKDNDLIISSNGNKDTLTIQNAYNEANKNLDFVIKDSTGTEMDFTELLNINNKNVIMTGTNSNDLLVAGKDGTYLMQGGSGNDTYIIDSLSSKITIQDDYGSNEIQIKNSAKDDFHIIINVDKNGNALSNELLIGNSSGEINVIANNYDAIDKITVKNDYYITSTQINELIANIASWLDGKAENVSDILASDNDSLINELYGICNTINWQTDTPTV